MPELVIMAPSLRVAQAINPKATRAGHISPPIVWDVEKPETMPEAIESFKRAKALGMTAYPSERDRTRCEPGEITELREIGAIQPRTVVDPETKERRTEEVVLKDVEIVMIGQVMGGSAPATHPRNPSMSRARKQKWANMTPVQKQQFLGKVKTGVQNSRYTQRSLRI